MEALGEIMFTKKQPESDEFCWTCHREEPQLFCSKCVRSFHISPACSHAKRMSAEAMGSWRCAECIALDKDKVQMQASGLDVQSLNKLLKYIADLLKADEYLAQPFLNVTYINTKGATVLNPMDLTLVGDKADNDEYSCIEEFWCDIKWIVHLTKCHRSGDECAVKATKWLTKFTKGEIYSIRLCHECYSNANQKPDNWFTKPCKEPHILVWAKQKGFPYWPGKLMAIDSGKHTVDVQFFGDHKRAVVASKECFIYSKTSPSVNLGPEKKKLEMAITEAEVYIQNLIMKFGSFHFAEPNTMLNETMLDRHLYDMIPNAWKNLVVPPPIPKPASATSVRRKTISPAMSRKSVAPKVVKPMGGTLTRRMSMAFKVETGTDYNENEHGPVPTEPPVRKFKSEPMVTATVSASKFLSLQKERSKNSLPSAKKRKLCTEAGLSNSQGTMDASSHQDDEPTFVGNASTSAVPNGVPCKMTTVPKNKSFKVPALPPVRKSSANQIPCTIIPLNNIPTFVQQPKKYPSVDEEMKNEDLSPVDQIEPVDNFGGLDDADQLIRPKTVHSPHMVELCNAMAENNTRKVTECIRSSLKSTLVDFLDAINPSEEIRVLQEQLGNQRIDYDMKVMNLKNQNADLREKLEEWKGSQEMLITKNNQLLKQNQIFIEKLTSLKAENENLVKEMNDEMAKTSNMDSNLNTKSMQNTKLASAVEHLKSINLEQSKILKLAEADNSRLTSTNKALIEATEKLKIELENLKLENQIQRQQMKEEKHKFDHSKTKAVEDFQKMLTDTKKNQWCATCGIPGGIYYCSSQCEELYWKQQRKD